MDLTWTQKLYIINMRLLSWILPQGGARLALRLFLKPTRIPRPSSEKEFYETARKFRLPSGIAAFQWGEEADPLVMLIHGWNGRGTQLGAFAKPLVEKGYRVVALDGPAHGDSPGETTNVGAFAKFLVEAQK